MNLEDRANFSNRNVESNVQQPAGNPINNHNTMPQTANNQTHNHNAQAKRGIGIFADYQTTEQALMELQDIGYGMERVSVIGQDAEYLNQSGQAGDAQLKGAHDNQGNHADDGAKTGAVSGGTLGGLTGLLIGLGTLAIPGVGPIMLAGAAATAIATTLAGGAIGAAAGGLMGGLIGLGIPEKQAKMYNDRISKGEYLVMVDGTNAQIAEAETILKRRGIREWGIYDVPTTGSAAVNQTASTVPNQRHMTPPAGPVVAAGMANPVGGRPISSTDAETVKLHEERLVVDKHRQKIGEVAIGKQIETETRQVSTPVEKERVVIVSVPLSGENVTNSSGDLFDDQQETARVEVFEETPSVRKETFVREEISIAKKATQGTVNTQETLRREELDVDSQGQPVVDNRTNRSNQNRR